MTPSGWRRSPPMLNHNRRGDGFVEHQGNLAKTLDWETADVSLHIRPPQSLRAPLLRMAPLLGWTSLPWLRVIRQPRLIVSGDDDPVTPPINHRIMAALISNAQFRTVKGGGHIMLIDSPARVAPVIATSSRVPAMTSARTGHGDSQAAKS